MHIENRVPSVAEYGRLRERVGWWAVDERSTGKALENSLYAVVAVEKKAVIGFGRVVGDGGLYFYIQDLMVHPDFQAMGVGRALMTELMEYIRGTSKPGAFVGLMAAQGLERFYEPFGFRSRDTNAPGMYLVIE